MMADDDRAYVALADAPSVDYEMILKDLETKRDELRVEFRCISEQIGVLNRAVQAIRDVLGKPEKGKCKVRMSSDVIVDVLSTAPDGMKAAQIGAELAKRSYRARNMQSTTSSNLTNLKLRGIVVNDHGVWKLNTAKGK